MRLLYLCHKVPYPAVDGGALAILNMLSILKSLGYDIKLLTIATQKHPVPQSGFPDEFIQLYKPESYFLDTRIKAKDALWNLLFEKDSYHLKRFNDTGFKNKLQEVINEYKPSKILADSLYSCLNINFIKQKYPIKVVYRAHNIEHQIWQGIGKKALNPAKKLYHYIQNRRFEKEELTLIQESDAILSISESDTAFFKKYFPQKPLMKLPFSIDLNQYGFSNDYTLKSVFFIGAMDWYPNAEGIKWFIDHVWERVCIKHPDAVLHIAGKAMPTGFLQIKNKQIKNFGEVRDAKAFMNKLPIMIAPIFTGGGIKIKVIEAMAMQKVVIGTPFSMIGIMATDKKNFLQAQTADDFVSALEYCFTHTDKLSEIGHQAHNLINTEFNMTNYSESLNSFLNTL